MRRGGVPCTDEPITLSEIQEWNRDFIHAAAPTTTTSAGGAVTSGTTSGTSRVLTPLSAKLAGQKPQWPLGQGIMGYHPLTVGLYVSELVKRIDPQHRGVQEFFKQEIAEPLSKLARLLERIESAKLTRAMIDASTVRYSLASSGAIERSSPLSGDGSRVEFYIGLPESFDGSRIARVCDGTLSSEQSDAEQQRIAEEAQHDERDPNVARRVADDARVVEQQRLGANHAPHYDLDAAIMTKAFRAVRRFSPWNSRMLEMPSAVGYTNAAALAFIYNALVTQLTNTPKREPYNTSDLIFDANQLRQAVTMSTSGFDVVLQLSDRAYTRAGFALDPRYPYAFHHSGTGGSIGWGDPSLGIAIAYTTNSLSASISNHARPQALVASVYRCVRSMKQKLLEVATATIRAKL